MEATLITGAQCPARRMLHLRHFGGHRNWVGQPNSLQARQIRPKCRWPHLRHLRSGASASASSSSSGAPGAPRAPGAAGFRWSSAVSQDPEADTEGAVAEAVRNALEGWPAGASPDVAFVFVSSSYQRSYERVLPLLREKLPSLQHVIGCSGYGVMGMREGAPDEREAQPALSVALAALPGVRLRTFHASAAALPDADAPPEAWHALLGIEPPLPEGHHTSLVLLADAGFGGVMDLLAGLDYAFPSARKVGGLNSSLSANARRALWQWSADLQGLSPSSAAAADEDGLRASGCVGLALQGPLVMDTLVAQGCRPLGQSVYSVARAHRSLLLEVAPEGAGAGGKRAPAPEAPLEVVKRELAALAPEERDVAARNLMVGLAPDDFKPVGELGPGDFLVRQLVGADQGSGALMVGDVLRVGQRMRLLVRDREGAVQDLVAHGVDLKKRELSASLLGTPLPEPLGCLLFTCNGRGRGLFREPNFDSRTLAEYVPVPSAGFFCNGEIGMVGSQTYLHGFTCSTAIFRVPQPHDQQQQQQQAAAAGEQEEQQGQGQEAAVQEEQRQSSSGEGSQGGEAR